MEYLGSWVTCDGVKPIDKIQGSKNMKPLTSKKQVRRFIGVVNYYRYMWARLSYTIAPLTNIIYSEVKFKWTKIEQDDFEKIKRIVDRNNLLDYLDFNEGYKIHTNAINYQLGAVITQKVKSTAFYSGKLTDTYKRYTVIEKELLRKVEALN